MILRRHFRQIEKAFFSTVKAQIQQKPTLAYGERVVFQGPAIELCLTTEQAELPKIKEGEILGQIKAATICGSDLHTFLGKRNEPFPSILGHEGVVEVVDHACDNPDINKGDRLTFTIADFCQNCERCDSNLHQKCYSLFKYGHSHLSDGTGWNGCYASHIVLRKGTHVTKLPDNLPSRIAAPLNCALATMVNAVSPVVDLNCLEKERKTNGKKTALIQGAGLLGLYASILFKEAGYKEIFCSDIHHDRLDMAAKFGALPIKLGSEEEHSLKNESCDVVLEACGVKSVFNEGLRVVKPGGTYVLTGMVHPDSKLDVTAEQIIRKCLTIHGIHNYGPTHLDQAVKFLSDTIDKYPYDDLISPSYSLHEINEAVELAKSQQYFRVCIEPNEETK